MIGLIYRYRKYTINLSNTKNAYNFLIVNYNNLTI